MSSTQDVFDEQRKFWHAAYSRLDTETVDVKSTLETWVTQILTDDGLSSDSGVRKLFSFKPPEPFFGEWTNENGNLSVEGKTIVALINPGDGISYEQCSDKNISVTGRRAA